MQDSAKISIRAPLAGSDTREAARDGLRVRISIRAPLAGSDGAAFGAGCKVKISIRAPLAGSDRYIL